MYVLSFSFLRFITPSSIMSSKILITGASGGVGKYVLSQLLELTPQPSIRVSSRDPSKLNVPASVEVVKGDLADPSTYTTLFNNVGKVFLYMQGTEKTAAQVVKAAKDAGVRHIVFLSSAGVLAPGDNYLKRVHVQVEEVIKESGLTYTFLRPGGFSSNSVRNWGPQIKFQNKITSPFLNSHVTPIASEDIAAVVVVALTSSRLDNATPKLTGPRSLTQLQQIETISKVRQETKGEKVGYQEITPEQWSESVKGKVPDEIIDALLKLYPLSDGIPQPISPEFEKITGKKGIDYEDWVRLHKDEFF